MYMKLTPTDMMDGSKEIMPIPKEVHVGLNSKDERNVSLVASCMDNHVSGLVPLVDADLNLNVEENNGLKEANEEVGLIATRPNKQIAKWTRLSRMEVGSNDLKHSSSTLKLGKRSVEGALYVSCETGAATLPQKRSKLGISNDDSEFTSAGVDDHPC